MIANLIRLPTHMLAVRAPRARPGERIGILGGTFDPPHEAHLASSETALRRLGLDRIWWLVTPGNPLKSHAPLAPLEERLASSRGLARHPAIEVTDFEKDLATSYTAGTAAFLKARFPGTRFVWIMGADNLAGFHRWHEWRQIAGVLPIAVIDRPGWRYRALSSPAARALARGRLQDDRAGLLATATPPAWAYLSNRLLPHSSTAIRALTRGKLAPNSAKEGEIRAFGEPNLGLAERHRGRYRLGAPER